MWSRSVVALLGLSLTLAVLSAREASAQSPAAIEPFVTGLYVSLLGHQPDPQGLSTWTTVVAGNCTAPGLVAVTRAFLGSEEFADRSRSAMRAGWSKLLGNIKPYPIVQAESRQARQGPLAARGAVEDHHVERGPVPEEPSLTSTR